MGVAYVRTRTSSPLCDSSSDSRSRYRSWRTCFGAGYYHSPGWNRDYPHLQIRTIEQLLTGQAFDHPPTNVTLAQAGRIQEQGQQVSLF